MDTSIRDKSLLDIHLSQQLLRYFSDQQALKLIQIERPTLSSLSYFWAFVVHQ